MAGYSVTYANEFTPTAQDTYRANHPKTFLDTRDIRKVKARDIQEVLWGSEIDLFDSFLPVISGNSWDKVGLSWEHVRLIKDLQPKTFIANISSRVISRRIKGVAKLVLDLFEDLKKAGYEVDTKMLDASWLGVPQPHERIIFVGVRRDLARRYHVKPAYPRALPYQYTIKDALPDYDANRPLNIIEQKKIHSFPDDYVFTADTNEQGKYITRSFPPIMMSYIAKTVQTEILDKCR